MNKHIVRSIRCNECGSLIDAHKLIENRSTNFKVPSQLIISEFTSGPYVSFGKCPVCGRKVVNMKFIDDNLILECEKEEAKSMKECVNCIHRDVCKYVDSHQSAENDVMAVYKLYPGVPFAFSVKCSLCKQIEPVAKSV